ncbi:MAG: peptidoglycan DD-metalloendopeptidase family protein [Myxococcales bacterium]|nr:peptidoglycan DD-metalloendopeptidase family protein [Myxococcales bacterium]
MFRSIAARSTGVCIAIAAMIFAGCAEVAEDLDPAGTLGGADLSHDGPPAGEGAESQPTGQSVDEISSAPRFQLPFPCGQVWAGQTRTNHSPVNSVDFNRTNDLGDAVVAAAGGTITRVGNEGNTSYGRWIEIDHGGGYRTRYAHLSTQEVRVGQRVGGGQRIGTVGSTGGSSGPHLHYEVRLNGVAVRPTFNGVPSLFFGTRNYTSQNACGGGGGGGGGGSAGVVGRVNTSGISLTVRSGPGTNFGAVGSVGDGATVRITCQARGTSVTGTYGTSTLWDFIGTGYVSDAYVSTGSDGQVAPTCR